MKAAAVRLLAFIGAIVYSRRQAVGQHHASQADTTGGDGWASLDPDSSLHIHWSARGGQLRLAVRAAPHSTAFRWLAIGFSDRGELRNADLCLFWIDADGRQHFEDTYTDDAGRMYVDTQQDCENPAFDGRTRTLYFERQLDTCDDAEDYIVEDEGTTHIVWARGPDRLFGASGLRLLEAPPTNRGVLRARVVRPPSSPRVHAGALDVRVRDLHVPPGDTTYWCRVKRLPTEIVDKPHHIVQYEVVVTPGNEGLVHHMEVFYCDAPPDRGIDLYEGSCFDPERPNSTKVCSKVKAAWAMGAEAFVYPPAAGLPLGGRDHNPYIMLETHYNNPDLKTDWVDSSGIRLYVTPHLRRFDAAIMELGLEYTDKMAIPPHQAAFALAGYCVAECTTVGLPRSGITVFGSQLHTHLTGAAVTTQHYRAGVELSVLNYDNHYSSHFQEIRTLKKPVKILPGDSLVTTCLYDTRARTNVTVGGNAITDEMCVNYLHYYPATSLEVCKSSVGTQALEEYFKYEKEFDGMNTLANQSARNNYQAINPWNELRVEALALLYSEAPISMQCNQSNGHRFQGDWENMPLTEPGVPLPTKQRNCPNSHSDHLDQYLEQ